jgi:hypothetical protein
MRRLRVIWLGLLTIAGAMPTVPAMRASEPTALEGEFFEKKVRPLLVERCFECHGGGKKVRGGLSLASRAAILAGGDSGPAAVAGNAAQSLLLQAVRYQGDLHMPPKGKLTDAEIATFTRWVGMGLPWPSADSRSGGQPAVKSSITEEQKRFWAFQPACPVSVPAVTDSTWPRSDLDRFILASLEVKGLRPAKQADRRTLLRRITFDLTGLPPTPEDMAAFLNDRAPDAFAHVVDRLLASPHYGERWGRHWLDVARYADSFDARALSEAARSMDITEAWRYRDWVVDAFNRDLPYDQFVTLQLAGDLLATPGKGGGPNVEGVIATGILAIGNWGGGDADKEKMVTDIVDDQLDIVGRAFMGLTITCARCHDHKFDPISTEDYYGLAGIFFSTHILPDVGPRTNGPNMLRIPLISPEELAKRDQDQTHVALLEKQLKAVVAAGARQAGRALFPRSGPLLAAWDSRSHAGEAVGRLRSELAALRKNPPLAVPVAHGAQEGGIKGSGHEGTHDVRVHVRGSYLRLGERVPRHFPRILAGSQQPPITTGSGRLELARWLASPEHPLTARVMVNRLWQQHFGEGIVRTPNNFGKLGERPTHPELLDWLAGQFVQSGWSIKHLHRLILLSATYQQASEPEQETLRGDPDNRLFGRMNRRRLEAEEIRDSLLAVAGRLKPTAGGPATRDFADPRRTLYQMTIRSDRSGFGPLFDVPDSTATAEKRITSTIAPQALFLLNHPFVLEQTQVLSRRILAVAPENRQRIQFAYQLLHGRQPTAEEVQIGLNLLARSGLVERNWEEYCQVLFCANEFIYVD